MRIRQIVSAAVAGGVLFLAAIQFVRPARKDPPHEPLFEGAIIPSQAARVFERACQDCHSNNTHWPWYAQVAPFSLLIAEDVGRGRQFLNLSEWNTYSTGRKLGYLSSISDATRNRKMPPRLYSAMHADARLTEAERSLIALWARQERKRLRAEVVP